MKHLKIHGKKLKEKTQILNGDHFVLYEGDGELLGIGITPGESATILSSIGEITLHCRDLVEIIKIDKKTLVSNCEKILSEKATLGYVFTAPHYSNIVPINFKFKSRLSVKGPIDNLWFYLKV